jgi:predicted PurR-regulated permease PerM
MALLKKIRSATLLEALVSTILIVIIFLVASLVVNNLLMNSFKNSTHSIEVEISELEYKIHNKVENFPYAENYNGWDISISEKVDENKKWIVITAENKTLDKQIRKTFLNEN